MKYNLKQRVTTNVRYNDITLVNIILYSKWINVYSSIIIIKHTILVQEYVYLCFNFNFYLIFISILNKSGM